MRNARTGKGMTTDEDGSINKDMEMEMDRDTLMLQLHSLLKHDDDNDDDDSGDDGADVDDDDDDDEEYNSSNANANANANAMKILNVTRQLLDDGDGDGDGDDDDSNISIQLYLQHLHIRALLALGRYVEVLDSIMDDGSLNSNGMVIDHAYALYKLGRYTTCRTLIISYLNEDNHDGDDNDDDTIIRRGLTHILAQCYYHMQETQKAAEIYSQLLESNNEEGGDDGEGDKMSDILTNAYATILANDNAITIPGMTPTMKLLLKQTDMELEKAAEEANKEKEDDFPYELAFNHSTHQLVTSASVMQTKMAMEGLKDAERDCMKNAGGSGSGSAALTDVMPIRANIAYGKLQSGDWDGAMEMYLDIMAQANATASAEDGKSEGGSGNYGGAILAAENNLTILNAMRGGSSSVIELLQKLPDLSTYKSLNSSGKEKMTITPHQIRILLYNRALLLMKVIKTTTVAASKSKSKSKDVATANAKARSVVQALKSSLTPPSDRVRRQMEKGKGKGNHGHGNSHGNGHGHGNGNGHGKKKGKKKGLDSGNLVALPASDADKQLWECRIATLEKVMTGDSNGSGNGDDDSNNGSEGDLSIVMQEKLAADGSDLSAKDRDTLEYALAEMKLYEVQCKAGTGAGSEKEFIEALEGLPPSIRQRPATIATLCSLYGALGMEDKAEEILVSSSSDDQGIGRKSLADFKLRGGHYQEAAEIYDSILNNDNTSADFNLDEGKRMECVAGLVKALSYFDIDRAMEVAKDLDSVRDAQHDHNDDDNTEPFDGEVLEAMEIPRLCKASGGTNRSRKILGSGRKMQSQKKNEEAILRRRAKKRKAYLEKLQQEGKYNPDKPTKPDPERWIPKSQRSYNRRGRRGRTKFVGAQGGGSGFGADKDAAKLDVAARAAAKAKGVDLSGGQPSTAHLAVSSAGRRRR